MRPLLFVLAGCVALAWPSAPLHAQATQELDRLRGALRTLTAQARALEDQLAALQAQLNESNQEKERLNQQIEGYKAQVKEAQDAVQQAVEEFNRRLTERDESLDKWKAAYEEAATVARAKDAERGKFEAEAATFKARTKSCEAKNVELMKVGNEILAGYRDLTLGDTLAIKEPMIAIRRVEHQNRVQSCLDRILDQDAKLPAAQQQGTKEQGGKDQGGKDQGGKDQAKPTAAKDQGKNPGKNGKDQEPDKAGNQKKDKKVSP
jgi:chromosome segregation ATPase